MERRTVDADFLRFCEDGQPEALARVFDALAPRLLLLAVHLTRDASQAEDLVQTTFLHAIRDAQRYDNTRPVAAWLAGILSHRAADLQRRAELRSPSASMHEAEVERANLVLDPAELVASDEFISQVSANIEALDEPYREALVLRLVHGLEPKEIAHALGRPPGTVRMQLKRGVAKLRELMPERASMLGLALLDDSRGLAAVRELVLEHATAHAVPILATGASSSALAGTQLSLGGLLTMKGLLTGIALLILGLGFVAYNATDSNALDAQANGARSQGRAEVELDEEGVGSALHAPRTLEASSQADSRSAALLSQQAAVGSLAISVTYELTGEAAADIGIYLRRLDVDTLGDEMRTGPEGRAVFEALEKGLYSLHIDRLARVLTVDTLAVDALEIEIPDGLTVSGRVLQLGGEGVAEARIYRINPGHEDVLQLVGEADSSGHFELLGVPEGTELIARASGFQPTEARTVLGRVGETVELELQLGALGYALRGQVLDSSGEPVSCAWVAVCVDEDARDDLAGSSHRPGEDTTRKNMDRESFYLRADEFGYFESDEVPAGDALLIARPAVGDYDQVAWTTLWINSAGAQGVVLQFERGAQVIGTVSDREGRPVPGVTIEAEWEGTPTLGQTEGELGLWISDRRTTSNAEGQFVIAGLLPGEYDLRVRSERDRLAKHELEIFRGKNVRWDPVIDAFAELRVRLVDPSGNALAGWIVASSSWKGALLDVALAEAATDSEGRAKIVQQRSGKAQEVSLYASRAHFEERRLPLATRHQLEIGPAEHLLTVQPEELPNSSLFGSCQLHGGGPLAQARLRLEFSGWEYRALLEADANGAFRIDGLRAGSYRLLTDDPRELRDVALAEFELGIGEQRSIGVLGIPLESRLSVEVLDGAQANLRLEPINSTAVFSLPKFEQDETGAYVSQPIAPGAYQLTIVGGGLAPYIGTVVVNSDPLTSVQVERVKGLSVFVKAIVGDEGSAATEARSGLLIFKVVVWDHSGQRMTSSSVYSGGSASHLETTLYLEPGTYTLKAELRVDGSETFAEAQLILLAASTENSVVLDLR